MTEIIVFLLICSFLLGLIFFGLFFFSVRSGTYEDMDREASKILFEDD